MSKRILFPILVIAALWGAYELNKDNALPAADGGDVSQNQTPSIALPSDGLTASQRNAVREARSYLAIRGYSRLGLINQLSSDAGDGFSIEDATSAVDTLNVNWNENAVRTAKSYLKIRGFSCKGLISQLSSPAAENFTESQAEYGARNAGACD